MEHMLEMLSNTALFRGFTREETLSALLCLEGKVRRYSRKQIIYSGDEPMRAIGLVLSGMVYVGKADASGGQAILFGASEGEMIGEISLQDASAPDAGEEAGQAFSATAAEDCEILFVRTNKIAHADHSGTVCALRGRIMHYLELQARRNRSLSFAIPFSRADFADYLMVDRSALSRELCRMAADGLIAFSRNRFELRGRENAL